MPRHIEKNSTIRAGTTHLPPSQPTHTATHILPALPSMSGEDPSERPEAISAIINGLERYNPEAVVHLEAYLAQQCEERFCDCNANRTLLKLYVIDFVSPIGYLEFWCFPLPLFL